LGIFYWKTEGLRLPFPLARRQSIQILCFLGGFSALGTPVTVGAHKDHLAVHLLNFGVLEVEDSGRGLPRGEE